MCPFRCITVCSVCIHVSRLHTGQPIYLVRLSSACPVCISLYGHKSRRDSKHFTWLCCTALACNGKLGVICGSATSTGLTIPALCYVAPYAREFQGVLLQASATADLCRRADTHICEAFPLQTAEAGGHPSGHGGAGNRACALQRLLARARCLAESRQGLQAVYTLCIDFDTAAVCVAVTWMQVSQ